MKQLLIIECTPKKDNAEEGLILRHFLNMSVRDCMVHMIRRSSSKKLIGYIYSKQYYDLAGFNYVHLSGHGNKSGFITPKGNPLAPNEFPENCFKGKIVTLSACCLGRKDFMEEFACWTGAKYIVAPEQEVYFVDAALWFETFYYYVLNKGNRPSSAYKKTKSAFRKMKGDFKTWPP